MNNLNIKSLLLTKQLNKGEMYDFDYDNQITAHEKYDGKRTYKHTTGYFPRVATIKRKIVYIENRDGNANVKISQNETLARAYELIEENGITIHRSRMDAGSYAKDILDTVSGHGRLFCIRANKSESMFEQICRISDWKKVEINYKSYEVASIPFRRFFEDRNYRLEVMREKSDDARSDLFTGDSFIYRSILTNDHASSEKRLSNITICVGRVKRYSISKTTTLAGGRLPTSEMNSDTVFLILTAMMKNFYNHIIKRVSDVFYRYPFGIKNETLYIQVHLCRRKMDQAEPSMEAPALHRPPVRSIAIYPINSILKLSWET